MSAFGGKADIADIRGSSCGGHSFAGVKREQMELDGIEKPRSFKGCPVARLVRDEGVAGSNPATPTSSTNKALIGHIFLPTLSI